MYYFTLNWFLPSSENPTFIKRTAHTHLYNETINVYWHSVYCVWMCMWVGVIWVLKNVIVNISLSLLCIYENFEVQKTMRRKKAWKYITHHITITTIHISWEKKWIKADDNLGEPKCEIWRFSNWEWNQLFEMCLWFSIDKKRGIANCHWIKTHSATNLNILLSGGFRHFHTNKKHQTQSSYSTRVGVFNIVHTESAKHSFALFGGFVLSKGKKWTVINSHPCWLSFGIEKHCEVKGTHTHTYAPSTHFAFTRNWSIGSYPHSQILFTHTARVCLCVLEKLCHHPYEAGKNTPGGKKVTQ